MTHYRRRVRLAAATASQVQTLWRQIDQRDLAGSWLHVGPRIVRVISAAQATAAGMSEGYVEAALVAQNFDADPAGTLIPHSLAGIASDGRPLESLARQPLIEALDRMSQGVSLAQSMASGRMSMDRIVRTQVADAGRVGDGVSTVTRPKVDWYVRVLTPPSCSRCAILAGRYYRSDKPFLRHPRCLPAGTVVSGPSTLATTRRPYQGELVTVRTAGGQELAITGNHPVLTDRGWIAANLLQEGDNVVRGVLGQGARSLVVPDEHQVPSRIEDVWRAGLVGPLVSVPTSTEDFHGDGGHGEVGVVFADGELRDRALSSVCEPGVHSLFSTGMDLAGDFPAEGHGLQVLLTLSGATRGVVSRLGLSGSLFGGHLGGSSEAGFGASSRGDFGVVQQSPDGATGYAVPRGDTQLALPAEVCPHDFSGGKGSVASRWDAAPDAFSVENIQANAGHGRDLLHRLAGQVELDRIVELRRAGFSGHVYNLNSSEGWFAANGIVVSNCDCLHAPVGSKDNRDSSRLNVREYFDSLSTFDQDRTFTKAGAQAIRDGADINQVVNARRGMSPASSPTRTTTEGMTRRGFANRRTGPLAGSGSVRLMPEAIYALASDRDEILSLLRRFSYIS